MYIYRLFSPVCRHTSLYRYSDDFVDNVLIWTLITLSHQHLFILQYVLYGSLVMKMT